MCSGHSFGVQCERTCNCKDNGACDDITGECPNVCQNGWNNDTCGKLSYITIVDVKYIKRQKRPSLVFGIHGKIN